MAIKEQKVNKKKEPHLELRIKNAGTATPKIIWTAKHGTIGEKVSINKDSWITYPVSGRKALYLPYFIVDAGDEIILKEIP